MSKQFEPEFVPMITGTGMFLGVVLVDLGLSIGTVVYGSSAIMLLGAVSILYRGDSA